MACAIPYFHALIMRQLD